MYDQYAIDFGYWRDLYAKMWSDSVRENIPKREQSQFISELRDFARSNEYEKLSTDDFYRVQTEFNSGLDELKMKIARAKIVSFDVFDTLILRPFLTPTTLFYFMDTDFRKSGSLNIFHDLRIAAEQLARQKSPNEDITLDEIYQEVVDSYGVTIELANQLKEREVALEERFCCVRKTGRELFDFAKALNKRIIIASDMYLPKSVIEKILKDNGYNGYEHVFISSDIKLGKHTGSLFHYIYKKLDAKPREIIHIDDNTDVIAMAKRCGLMTGYLPKAGSMLDRYNIVDKIFTKYAWHARGFTGIDVTLGLVANKLFDNPFVSFNSDSVFNCSPAMVGYAAFGPVMFDLTRWLANDTKDKKIDQLIFLARDGYLPKLIFDQYAQKMNLDIKTFYMPTSRKAILPLTVANKSELRDTLQQFSLGYQNVSASIVKSFNTVLKPGSDEIAIRNWAAAKGSKGVSVNRATEIIGSLIDYSRALELRRHYIATYGAMFDGCPAVFDVGYSGKPEVVFAHLFAKDIETYFIYITKDEPLRRLGKHIHYYGRWAKIGIRELLVSSRSSSCIGYKIAGDGVEPVFDKYNEKYYSERFAIEQFQSGATEFCSDILENFADLQDSLYWPDHEIVSMGLDSFIDSPTWFDAQLFRHIIHEDDVGVGSSVDAYQWYKNQVRPPSHAPATLIARSILGLEMPGQRVKRVLLYALFDRQTLKEKIYSKARPVALALRYPYRAVRSVRRGWRHIVGR